MQHTCAFVLPKRCTSYQRGFEQRRFIHAARNQSVKPLTFSIKLWSILMTQNIKQLLLYSKRTLLTYAGKFFVHAARLKATYPFHKMHKMQRVNIFFPSLIERSSYLKQADFSFYKRVKLSCDIHTDDRSFYCLKIVGRQDALSNIANIN